MAVTGRTSAPGRRRAHHGAAPRSVLGRYLGLVSIRDVAVAVAVAEAVTRSPGDLVTW
ncbi:hypothetical protein [Streptomyces sp. NPDC057690]|uniref:hypothetical protein n=1 Tax=Streptomyces sp. NPDC057690 TaxID=3346214 RepID=UPI00368882AB